MTRPERDVLTIGGLNALSPDEAVGFFLDCCGSTRWAQKMSECRPFWDRQVVLNAADAIWEYLTPEDWREALNRRRDASQHHASPGMRGGMEQYEEKFGYVFVIDPDTPEAKDPPGALKRRLENTVRYEITLAAAAEGGVMRKALRRKIRD